MKEIIVTSKYDGKKLNTFLLDTFGSLSMNLLYKTLRKKDIRVNNVKVSENVVVHTGDNIKVFLSDEELFGSIINVEIIYEDENIIAVNKPCGIEVTGNNNSLTYILNNFLKQRQCSEKISNCNFKSDEVYPCHRLDRNTTGIVLFAKNEPSLDILLNKFKNREIEKHYHTTVYGIPKNKHSDLTAYLFKDSKKSLVYISDVPKKGYEKIKTSYDVINIDKKANTSILDVTLHTGKTHQIRAHLAHIGLPIIGDGKYGNNEINKKFKAKVQMLTSYSIEFKFVTTAGHLEYLNGTKLYLKRSV